jgi:predicted DNA-binding antitoxin AbrB/MazE fold protein
VNIQMKSSGGIMHPTRQTGRKPMTRSITAVFEAGLLRPTTPLELAEGTRVELIIISDERNGKQPGRTAANILAGIAALPTAGGDPRTSQDHDQVLYSEHGAR